MENGSDPLASFVSHRIPHLSASSCNLWAAAPALWVLKYLYRYTDTVGAAAHRGTASEAGIAHGLATGAPLKDCVDKAEAHFDLLTSTLASMADGRREKERAAIAGLVQQGLDALRAYGPPAAMQRKIEHTVPGLPPFIGYLDFEWPGIVVDLKTQMALAGSVRASHARQLALYVAGTNSEARVLYATPKKSAVYIVEEAPAHMAALVNIACSLGRFLGVSPDRAVLAGLISADVESFYYSDPAIRQAAFEVFGV